MSKKLLTLCALCMFAVSALFAGCGQDSSDKAASSGEKVLRVGTTLLHLNSKTKMVAQNIKVLIWI